MTEDVTFPILACASSADIADHLNGDYITKIKETGDRLEMYTVAHPDTNVINIEGMAGKALRWLRATIEKIRVPIGTPIFGDPHTEADNPNREKIGEVIKKWVKNGKLQVIVRRYKEHAKKKFDSCSFELDIFFPKRTLNQKLTEVTPDMPGAVTGIALLDSKKDPPGFPGARLMAYANSQLAEENEVTKEEVIELFKELQLQGTGSNEIRQVNLDAQKRGQDYAWQRNTERLEKAEKEVDRLKAELEAKAAEVEKSIMEKFAPDLERLAKIDAMDGIAEVLDRRKDMNDRQRSHITGHFWNRQNFTYGEKPDFEKIAEEGLKDFQALYPENEEKKDNESEGDTVDVPTVDGGSMFTV